MLVRDVAHEARNGGEATARTLAAPVVAVTEGRESGHRRWRSRVGQDRSSHARLDSGNACTRKRGLNARSEQPGKALKPAQEPVSRRNSVTCDKRPSSPGCETCCGSWWTSRSQTLNDAREINEHQRAPADTSVEKPTWETERERRQRKKTETDR